MRYISTRNRALSVTASQAIVQGIAPDGGLFLPERVPQIGVSGMAEMLGMNYPARSAYVLSKFLTDFTLAELEEYTRAAYGGGRFPENPLPVVTVRPGESMLELFHGPTCAFKDVALQLLPRLLTASLRKNGETRTVLILVATSGDTGKAALAGFADAPGTKICVFYPDGGTSNIQRLQMTTQKGENVMVAAVKGNFDDAQTGVKRIFTDPEYRARLADRGVIMSSANSINWGRLAPQIAYYYSAYLDLVNSGEIKMGDMINAAVPTGNFGDILAAYYAKLSGLPVGKLICASNENNVLADFMATGVYDKNRAFHVTASPSMDILVSSNLERLLFLLSGGDDSAVKDWMGALAETGRYEITPAMKERLLTEFAGGFADDHATAETIRRTWAETGYLADPHTAVGIRVYEDYRARTGDRTPTVINATASPFKFCQSVLSALGAEIPQGDFEKLDALARLCGHEAPESLSALRGMRERFADVFGQNEMIGAIERVL